MASLAPPPKAYPVVADDGRAEPPWYDWALRIAQASSGISTTITLAKITALGSDGSLTIVNGRITAVVQPT